MSLTKNHNSTINPKSFTKVLAIDFETANSYHDTACSLGVALLKNGEITLSKEFLINPESHFDDANIEIHKITEDMVKDSPTFQVIWDEVINLIDDNTLIIAHNVNFDLAVLRKLINRYNLEAPSFQYLCTHEAYKRNTNLPSYKLNSIAKELNLDFQHHRAEDDALICLKIFMNLLDNPKDITKDFLEKNLNLDLANFSSIEKKKATERKFNGNFFKKKTFKASDITTINTEFDVNHPVYGNIFVVTGDLINIELKEAAQIVVDLGGIYKDSLVKNTNYLIIGTNLQTNMPSIGTTKYNKAKEKFLNGDNIKLINEEEFLKLIDYKEKENPIAETKEEAPLIEDKELEIAITKESPKENEKAAEIEEFGQLSFELPLIEKTKEAPKELPIENKTSVEGLSIDSYIAPSEEFIKFNSLEEKIEKLKEFKLISAKSTTADKTFFYKGVFSNKAIPCEIIGYLHNEVLVIEVENSLHSIRGEYLKQMQDSNFSNFTSI